MHLRVISKDKGETFTSFDAFKSPASIQRQNAYFKKHTSRRCVAFNQGSNARNETVFSSQNMIFSTKQLASNQTTPQWFNHQSNR